MAEFGRSYARTMRFERGYTRLPHETYWGVDRRWHPTWAGWALIDGLHGPTFAAQLAAAAARLDPLLREFYRAEFWNVVAGDVMADQAIADELFDAGVMSDPNDGVRFLQRALNGLNDTGAAWDRLAVDGACGRKTQDAVAAARERYESTHIVAAQKAYRLVHCLEAPGRAGYVAGWVTRIGVAHP